MRSDALRRRTQIVDAACLLLSQFGQHIKLEEVAAEAGVGIATLYRHFPTRNALIYECVLHICEIVNAQLDETLEKLASDPEDNEQAFRDLVAAVFPSGMNILIPALITPPEELLSEEFRTAKYSFTERANKVLKMARDKELIHDSVSDLDLFLGLVRLYQAPESLWGGPSETPRNVHQLVDIFLKGCEKGI